MIAGVTAAIAALALLLSALFAQFYAASLPAFVFFTGLIWLHLVMVVVWFVLVTRLQSERRGKGRRPARIYFRSGAGPLAIGFGVLSIGWMLLALLQPPHSAVFRLHWLLQLILATSFGFFAAYRYAVLPGRARQENGGAVEANLRKRSALISLLDQFSNSDWLQRQPAGSDAARLRAAIAWWQEELEFGLPPERLIMSNATVTHLLDEAKRQTDFLESLHERRDMSGDALLEAERSVLDNIERIANVIRTLGR